MAASVSAADVDPYTIAFGSCHRLSASRTLLPLIPPFSPSAFLWLGDAVYVKNSSSSVAPLRSAFDDMKAFRPYADLVSSLEDGVHGTYDDHDYGQNDAGKHLGLSGERRDSYLDFLGAAEDDDRRERDRGVYGSSVLGEGRVDGGVRVIFLDTRAFRDDHRVPSVGGKEGVPFAAVAAAFSRLLVKLLGVGRDYDGEMLGEEVRGRGLQSPNDDVTTTHTRHNTTQHNTITAMAVA